MSDDTEQKPTAQTDAAGQSGRHQGLTPMFASYYQVRDLPNVHELHDELIAIARRECKPNSRASSNPGTARSSGNIFRRSDPVLKEFKQHLVDASRDFLKEYMPRVFARTPKRMRIDIGGWAYVLKPGDVLNPHVHHEGVLSGTYYLKLPEKIGRGHGGHLILMNPNIASLMTRAPMPAKDNVQPPIREGAVVLFPSYIPHYVQAFQGKAERIAYAFDVTLKAAPEQAPGRQSQKSASSKKED